MFYRQRYNTFGSAPFFVFMDSKRMLRIRGFKTYFGIHSMNERHPLRPWSTLGLNVCCLEYWLIVSECPALVTLKNTNSDSFRVPCLYLPPLVCYKYMIIEYAIKNLYKYIHKFLFSFVFFFFFFYFCTKH